VQTIALLSGGMDSCVLLAYLIAQHKDTAALSVHYGQRHVRELDAARKIAAHFAVEHHVLDLVCLRPLLKGSSQTDDAVCVPEGHYAEDTMKLTVVPNRNMILLSIAGAWALSRGATAISYAAHAGDHTIYPDCRPAFVAAMNRAFGLCDWKAIRVDVPFQFMSKGEIACLGKKLQAPFELTWTCYKGQERPCEQCGACQERAEAFGCAGMRDPLLGKESR